MMPYKAKFFSINIVCNFIASEINNEFDLFILLIQVVYALLQSTRQKIGLCMDPVVLAANVSTHERK